MRVQSEPGIALADLGNLGEAPTESDTSAHSYTLQDVVVHDDVRPSPFAAAPAQAQRISMTSASSLAQAPGRQIPAGTRRPSEDMSVTGRRPSAMRVSIDIPGDRNIENLDNALIQGRVVRRRRRLPLNVVLCFGIVSVMCLAIGLTTLSIGIYNFTKLKASRAAKTVAALSDDISPLIHALYNKLFNANTVPPP